MPMFRTSPFEDLVVKATHEQNVTDDWTTILDICDKTVNYEDGAKYCLQAIKKRLTHKVPRVVMQALTLLDACVKNCGKKFHLEVSSRYFVAEIPKLLSKMQITTADKAKQLLKRWAENEFKDDPELGLIPSLYYKLKSEGVEFYDEPEPSKQIPPPPVSLDPNVVNSQQEEEDVIKAIALSLKDTGKSDVYVENDVTDSSLPCSSATSEPEKVRALYDFEAVEDNELTIKAGEIVLVLDKSNSSWWKGSNHRGEGYIPSNFVTEDLDARIDNLNGEVSSKEEEEETLPKVIDDGNDDWNKVTVIDEEKIQRTLDWLNDIDPCDDDKDPEELLLLERQSNAMVPLIEEKLQQIDKKCTALNAVNDELVEAIQLFYSLNSLTSDTVSPSSGIRSDHVSNLEMQQPTFPSGHYVVPQHYMLKQVERSVSSPMSSSQGHFISVPTHPSQANLSAVPYSGPVTQNLPSYCYQPVLTVFPPPDVDSSYQLMLSGVPEQHSVRHSQVADSSRTESQAATASSSSSQVTNETVSTNCGISAVHPGMPLLYQPLMIPPQFASVDTAHIGGVALTNCPSNVSVQQPSAFVHGQPVNTYVPHYIAQVVMPASSSNMSSTTVDQPSTDANSAVQATVRNATCILDSVQELPTSVQSCLPVTAVSKSEPSSAPNTMSENINKSNL